MMYPLLCWVVYVVAVHLAEDAAASCAAVPPAACPTADASSLVITCRKPLALKQDVEVQLDEHFRVKFTRRYELQLFFCCEGCQLGLSLLHGALLPGAAEASCTTAAQQQCGQVAKKAGMQGNGAAGGPGAGAGTGAVAGGSSAGAEVARAAAAATAASEGTQDLLARARALMAADFSDLVAPSSSTGSGSEQAGGGVAGGSTCTASGVTAAAAEAEDDSSTQQLLARARALMAASTDS